MSIQSIKDRQNVTLSLPKDVLRKAKIIAIERNTSLSGLLTQLLMEAVKQEERYETSMRNHLKYLEEASDLGTEGRITWKREELHER